MPSFPPSPTLLPPRRSLEDPGARDLESSENEDDHFSDASEGRPSGRNSPVPLTRVEKVDDEPSYGEVPGTAAYKMRAQDAVPDIVGVAPHSSKPSSPQPTSRPTTPGGETIPLTVVEKVDPSSPSHGEVPGTTAHAARRADAVPDLVLKSSESGIASVEVSPIRSRSNSTPGDLPIPITKVSKVDTTPKHGEIPGTYAYKKRKGDADPDIVEAVEGLPTSPSHRSQPSSSINRESSHASDLEEQDETEDKDGGFGDDFDDFEEGEEGEDDFGDFDDGLQQRNANMSQETQANYPPLPSFPIRRQRSLISLQQMLDFDELDSPSEVVAAATNHFRDLFTSTESIEPSRLEALPRENTIFLTDRSASLWAQLVAPPPLQPPNWLRSRIRRLFLVSLGVPIDLDEILPASKQKKLILPSIHFSSSPRPSSDSRPRGAQSKTEGQSGSGASESSQGRTKPRKGPPPQPEMDLTGARILCGTTYAALEGFSDDELMKHMQELEDLTQRAGEVLEYWLRRKDGAIGDKEAFEGVIENLVKHARKVRK